MARVWGWKDDLPEQRLVCAGKHLGGRASLVSLGTLPALYALTGRAGKPSDFRGDELSPIERDVAAALLENGPTSSAELPHLAGHERKKTHAAAERLQKRLVVTAAGRQERERGWPAVILDILPRRYAEHLRKLPKPEDARTELAATVLRTAREISAADLAGVIGGSRKACAAALDRLADEGSARARNVGDYVLWTASKGGR
jgi:winged helix DNA-binding protein